MTTTAKEPPPDNDISSFSSTDIDWSPTASTSTSHHTISHSQTYIPYSPSISRLRQPRCSNGPTTDMDANATSSSFSPPELGFPAYLYPHGSYSLSGIATRAAGLGVMFGISLCLLIIQIYRSGYWQLPCFAILLSIFHFLEFWTTARYNTQKAKKESFLLTNNGMAYNIAHTVAITESLIETYFFPYLNIKFSLGGITTFMGLLFVIVGQTVRTFAMIHAGANFNHFVQREKEEGHVLVKHGVYRYFRHPSYFGFFYWAIGTQLILGNPICFMGYFLVLWKFFKDRITQEEKYLVEFFPGEYEKYRDTTRTWIPRIK